MLAYAITLRCEHLALVYPWQDKLFESRETTYRLAPVGDLQPTLTVMCLKLDDENLAALRGGHAASFGEIFLNHGL